MYHTYFLHLRFIEKLYFFIQWLASLNTDRTFQLPTSDKRSGMSFFILYKEAFYAFPLYLLNSFYIYNRTVQIQIAGKSTLALIHFMTRPLLHFENFFTSHLFNVNVAILNKNYDHKRCANLLDLWYCRKNWRENLLIWSVLVRSVLRMKST